MSDVFVDIDQKQDEDEELLALKNYFNVEIGDNLAEIYENSEQELVVGGVLNGAEAFKFIQAREEESQDCAFVDTVVDSSSASSAQNISDREKEFFEQTQAETQAAEQFFDSDTFFAPPKPEEETEESAFIDPSADF